VKKLKGFRSPLFRSFALILSHFALKLRTAFIGTTFTLIIETVTVNTIEVVVETPKGSRYKYKYDKKKDRLIAHKLLPVGLTFPYDFGFIPGTKGEDGDPIDVMIVSEDSFIPGSVVQCQILCSIEATQTSSNGKPIENDRILVVPNLMTSKEMDIAFKNLSFSKVQDVIDFFSYYNEKEGKKFNAMRIINAAEAWEKLKKQL
jgi:inorganic pyrophosphatase